MFNFNVTQIATSASCSIRDFLKTTVNVTMSMLYCSPYTEILKCYSFMEYLRYYIVRFINGVVIAKDGM